MAVNNGKPLHPYLQWLKDHDGMDDVWIEAMEAAVDLNEYRSHESLFDRPDDYREPDGDLLTSTDPDNEDDAERLRQALERESKRHLTIKIRGDIALAFVEAFGHVADHDCEWGENELDLFLGLMYQTLGTMLFDT